MASHLNIKLLVANVHKLAVLLIFFDFLFCLFPGYFLALGSSFKNVFCMKKFPVRVVIFTL